MIRRLLCITGAVVVLAVSVVPIASASPAAADDEIELVCPNNVAPRAGKCPTVGSPFGVGGGGSGGGGGCNGLLCGIPGLGGILGNLPGGLGDIL